MTNTKGWRRQLAAMAMVLAAGAALPATAAAQDACPPEKVTQPFVPQGDDRDYFLAPGGDFEADPLVWSTEGRVSTRVSGRAERYGGPTVLILRHGAATTSPAVCIDYERPLLRFWIRTLQDDGRLVVKALDGLEVTTLATLRAARFPEERWTLSPEVPITGPLGVMPGQVRNVALRITTREAWEIDAIAIDPTRMS